MANIKYKKWILKKSMSVDDLLLLMDEKKSPSDKIKAIVKLLESKRVEGPKITTAIEISDLNKLQETLQKAFL